MQAQQLCEITGVCGSNDNLCVDCESSLDCNLLGGETCDTETRTCVGPPIDDDATLCNACSNDADCGGNGNLCSRIPLNSAGTLAERACTRDCSEGQACPQGFACGFVEDAAGIVVGQQCLPATSAAPFPTCDAHRDLLNATFCLASLGALCGNDTAGLGDAACLPPDDVSNTGICTIPCELQTDCPAGYSCDDITVTGFPFARACVD
jgi:hypothetical protein